MMPAALVRLALAAGVWLGAGCRRPSPPPPPLLEIPTPEIPEAPAWPPALAAVRAAVNSGQFATADSILAAFEREHGDAPEADHSAFWRALLRADPRNPAFKPADARAALDRYIARPDAERYVEAHVLRHLLTTVDSLRTAHANLRAATDSRDRAREEEMQKLRDELQRTQAELDRIKRRLGQPKP